MDIQRRSQHRKWRGTLFIGLCLAASLLAQVDAQTEQRVDVVIRDFTYRSSQAPLIPGVATLISIKNEDAVRHDFGSFIFQGSLTEVETSGVIAYGRGIEGVFVDPARAVTIRFMAERPGRYEFRCSIHPTMKGELLLLNIGAV